MQPSRTLNRCLLLAAVMLAVMALSAACAYRGADDPISRKFTWFSYLNGDDLRAACSTGALPRYRFVYNGIYIKQVRTYDIVPDPQGRGKYVLKARVIGPTDLSTIVIENPVNTLIEDPLDLLAPGRGVIAKATLSERDLDRLDQALARSGFLRPAPSGLYLTSEDFFWLGSACIGGRFFFNAYKWPSAAFTEAIFPTLLMEWDSTGIPLNPPRKLSNVQIYGDDRADESSRFTVSVGENGLVGVNTLF